MSKTKSRSFKIKDGESSYGRYTGYSPYQAANKALSEIIRKNTKDGKKSKKAIKFTLVESTKGQGGKIHNYEGKRVKLSTPVTYQTSNGVTITKNFKNELKKIKKTEN